MTILNPNPAIAEPLPCWDFCSVETIKAMERRNSVTRELFTDALCITASVVDSQAYIEFASESGNAERMICEVRNEGSMRRKTEQGAKETVTLELGFSVETSAFRNCSIIQQKYKRNEKYEMRSEERRVGKECPV